MRFSERYGYKPRRLTLQIEEIDGPLRNRLWNTIDNIFFENVQKCNQMVYLIWCFYFKEIYDDIRRLAPYQVVREIIRPRYFQWEWHEVYDFIEFLVSIETNESLKEEFKTICNWVLQEELSAYRFVGDQLVPISKDEELQAVNNALKETDKLETVNKHLEKAVSLFSNRELPDYANSIKESISAVEAMCNLISPETGELGKTLNKLEKSGAVKIHPALKEAFKKLYGWTSDEGGIRHGLKEGDSKIGFEEAKFMLVSCSAFISYLIDKANKAGIRL